MEEIRVKDVIFSYRHIYLDNLRRFNKRINKHITINSSLIKNVTTSLQSYYPDESSINIKYNYVSKTISDLMISFYEKFSINSKYRDYAQIRKNSYGEYISNTNLVTVKDQKIAKEIECIRKEDFYKNIKGIFNCSNICITFTESEITFSCSEFIICYSSVGDLVYTYSPNPLDIEKILNTKIDLDLFDDYHKKAIKRENKFCGFDEKESDGFPGDYFIKENDSRILLKKIKKGKLPRYV